MKKLLTFLTILGFTALGLGLTAMAQDRSGQARTDSAQQQQQEDAQSARSFEGKITKAGHKLVLQDSSTRQAYQLDDQDKAKHFEGKDVKVVATMDPNTNTLHIVDIMPVEK